MIILKFNNLKWQLFSTTVSESQESESGLAGMFWLHSSHKVVVRLWDRAVLIWGLQWVSSTLCKDGSLTWLLVGGLSSSLAFCRRSQLLSTGLLTSSRVSDPLWSGVEVTMSFMHYLQKWSHPFCRIPLTYVLSLIQWGVDGEKEWMPRVGMTGPSCEVVTTHAGWYKNCS